MIWRLCYVFYALLWPYCQLKLCGGLSNVFTCLQIGLYSKNFASKFASSIPYKVEDTWQIDKKTNILSVSNWFVQAWSTKISQIWFEELNVRYKIAKKISKIRFEFSKEKLSTFTHFSNKTWKLILTTVNFPKRLAGIILFLRLEMRVLLEGGYYFWKVVNL